jgi:hypothetical protein
MTAAPHFPSRGSPRSTGASRSTTGRSRSIASYPTTRPTASRDASRRSTKQAIAETKAFVDATTLPADELPPALAAFFVSAARPATQARMAALASHGLGRDSELERRLCELIPVATR